MNYAGMQRDIVELFVEAGRDAQTHWQAFPYRVWHLPSARRKAHRRALKKAWRRRVTHDLRVARVTRMKEAVRRLEKLLERPTAPFTLPRATVKVAICPLCGHRIEQREGLTRWQHVGVQSCYRAREAG